jgi:hypothetical protein
LRKSIDISNDILVPRSPEPPCRAMLRGDLNMDTKRIRAGIEIQSRETERLFEDAMCFPMFSEVFRQVGRDTWDEIRIGVWCHRDERRFNVGDRIGDHVWRGIARSVKHMAEGRNGGQA